MHGWFIGGGRVCTGKAGRREGKGAFGKNGVVLLGDHFCCENDFSILKRKKRGHLYGKRNGTVVSKQALNTYLFGKCRREREGFPFNCEVSFGGRRKEEYGE